MNDLRGHFRPEFLNRLDEIILFKPLTKDNIGGIVDLMVKEDVYKRQECYQFENIEDFRSVINARYRLVPYLYSEVKISLK